MTISGVANTGWVLTEDKNDGWGDPKIEFHKDSYRVTVYDMGAGEGKTTRWCVET